MAKSSSNSLLALAELYYSRCVLFSKAQNLQQIEDDLNAPDDPVAKKNYQNQEYDNFINSPLIKEICGILHILPTKQQWQSWIERNRSILEPLIKIRGWYTYVGNIKVKTLQKTLLVISKQRTLEEADQQFDIISESILQASPPIPTLYVIERTFSASPISDMPIELAHEGYLVDALQEIVGGNESDWSQFIKDNKAKIDSIRRFFNKTPKMLGKGSDGMAFDIGGGKVLKIFTDLTSLHKAIEAMHRLHKEPALAKTEAMIYDAGRLGQYSAENKWGMPNKQDIYYYIIEKMNPIRNINDDAAKIMRDILDMIKSEVEQSRGVKWNNLKLKITNPKLHEEVKKEVAQEAEIIHNHIVRNFPYITKEVEELVSGLRQGWLKSYIEEVLMKFLTGRTDLAMRNLGLTGYGEFRYFDPAYEGFESEISSN
jgi:hypothetical protein